MGLFSCPTCGRVLKTAQGLQGHLHLAHSSAEPSAGERSFQRSDESLSASAGQRSDQRSISVPALDEAANSLREQRKRLEEEIASLSSAQARAAVLRLGVERTPYDSEVEAAQTEVDRVAKWFTDLRAEGHNPESWAEPPRERAKAIEGLREATKKRVAYLEEFGQAYR